MKFATPARSRKDRRGTAVVEFAVAAPLLLILSLGAVEASRLYEVNNKLLMAAREGARVAAMDHNEILGANQSINDKIVSDVRTFLAASGLPADQATVSIEDANSPGTPMDLAAPANKWALFRVRIQMPYAAVGTIWFPQVAPTMLEGDVVFRNAVSTMAQ